jgi:hypothetical protein
MYVAEAFLLDICSSSTVLRQFKLVFLLICVCYTFMSDSRRRILPAGMPNIILKRRQK